MINEESDTSSGKERGFRSDRDYDPISKWTPQTHLVLKCRQDLICLLKFRVFIILPNAIVIYKVTVFVHAGVCARENSPFIVNSSGSVVLDMPSFLTCRVLNPEGHPGLICWTRFPLGWCQRHDLQSIGRASTLHPQPAHTGLMMFGIPLSGSTVVLSILRNEP